MIYAIGIIILILLIAGIFLFFKCYKLKEYRTSIKMCEKKIDEALNSKYELINDLIKKIKDEKIKKTFKYDKNSTIYDREDSLFNVSFEINKYIKESKNIKLKNEINNLNALEENLDGLKDYYNTNVLNYNEIFLKKAFNKIFRLLRFEQFKSFKIRKLQEYEIFKN